MKSITNNAHNEIRLSTRVLWYINVSDVHLAILKSIVDESRLGEFSCNLFSCSSEKHILIHQNKQNKHVIFIVAQIINLYLNFTTKY